MRRGYIPATSSLDALMQQLQEAIANGDDAQTAALQAQIDALSNRVDTAQSTADTAQATGANARQMVINRDPRLATLEGVADTVQQALTSSEQVHRDLSDRIDQIQLTPGPAGKDGAPGRDGRDGRDGQSGADGARGPDGLSAYQVARASGYGGTTAQWLASLKGETGQTGQQGQPGTPADMTRVTALEAQKIQIEFRDSISVPAVSLLGLSGTTEVAVTWPNAYPDTNYTIAKPQTSTASASLIGKTDAVVKAGSITKTGCTITVTTTALLAAGAVTLSVLSYRKG